jgi:hypothetical protein
MARGSASTQSNPTASRRAPTISWSARVFTSAQSAMATTGDEAAPPPFDLQVHTIASTRAGSDGA